MPGLARRIGAGAGRGAANALRGAVRCMFPVASLGVLAGLLGSDQGRDVLIALIEFAGPEHGTNISGMLFLLAGCMALSVSIWYSMRWLLGGRFAGLPLPQPAGWGQRWMPRVLGSVAPAMVALALFMHDGGHPTTARLWALVFAATAVGLGLAYTWRGDLLVALHDRGMISSLQGRNGAQPGQVEPAGTLPPITLRIVVWAILLTLILGVMMFLFPVTLPRVLGAATVAAIALASINLFGSFVLTYLPLRYGLPPLAIWALIWAAVVGAWNDNHRVATVPQAAVRARPPLAEDFARFLGTVPVAPGSTPTVVFVASEGGGIRAAYWTAAVLEALHQRSPDLLRRHLYALSGVSGGSLGVSAWLMSHRADYCPQVAALPVTARSQGPRSATASLGMDFVSPAVAGLFFYDFAQRFVPVALPVLDRSRAVERGWERAFEHLPGRPFSQTLDTLYADCPALPRLLLNATVVETGQRAVLGPLALDAGDEQACERDRLYLNAMPVMAADLDTRRQSLAGLVHHSARFPVVSPAGRVERPVRAGCPTALRLVDGGYFDNSGVQTVIDLVLRLREQSPTPFRPVLLVVRNAASPLCEQQVDAQIAPSRVAPELTSVISALANARGSHAVAARAGLSRAGIDVIDLAVQERTDAANAPLGWALSDRVRTSLDEAAKDVAARAAPLLARDRVDDLCRRPAGRP